MGRARPFHINARAKRGARRYLNGRSTFRRDGPTEASPQGVQRTNTAFPSLDLAYLRELAAELSPYPSRRTADTAYHREAGRPRPADPSLFGAIGTDTGASLAFNRRAYYRAVMTSPAPQTSGRPTQLRKGMAIASVVLGVLGLPTFGLLFIGGLIGLTLGIVALLKTRSAPLEYGGKGIAIAGIIINSLAVVVMPFVLGIVAAIAIPSLLRARVAANESASIGDTRTMISAQIAYASANGGFYDTAECLAAPHGCIPGYSGPSFIDPSLAEGTPRHGYQSTFFPGSAAEKPGASVSPSSLQSFAWIMVPLSPGQTGVRGFCGDSRGQVCFTSDGTAPQASAGQCPESCSELK